MHRSTLGVRFIEMYTIERGSTCICQRCRRSCGAFCTACLWRRSSPDGISTEIILCLALPNQAAFLTKS